MNFQDWSSISLGRDVRTTRCGTRFRRVMIMDGVEDKVRMCFTMVLAREDAQSSCSDDTCARGFFPIGHRMKGPWNYGEGSLMYPFADARNFMPSERLDTPLVPVKRVPNATPPYWGRKSAQRRPPLDPSSTLRELRFLLRSLIGHMVEGGESVDVSSISAAAPVHGRRVTPPL